MRRFLLAILCCAACDSKPVDDAPAPEVPVQPQTAEQTPAETKLADALPEADVRAVLDAWLTAQNAQDFEQYSKLYASRFEGIRRTGPRTYRFDHDGWMKDRGRMFKKPMQVSAAEVAIATSDLTASVAFMQTWASGTYKDVGPKQLLIVKTDEGLRISREVMLESAVAGDLAVAYDPGKFALAIDGRILLDLRPKRGWESGPADLVARPTTARKQAEGTGYEDWVGREITMFGASGEVCQTKVSGLELVARVNPHFVTVQQWNGEDGAKKASDGAVAAELWRLGTEFGNGVGLFATVENQCDGANWARPTAGAAKPLPVSPLEGPAKAALVESFTDLPGFHNTQSDFDKAGYRGAWHLTEGSQRTFRAFGPWSFATATAGAGCGDFEGALWAIWSRAEDGSLTLSSTEEGQQYFAPVAAAEVDGGTYFVEPARVLGKVGERWEVVWDASVVDLDCGC